MFTRRQTLALGLAVPGLAALAACGPNAAGGGGGGADADGTSSLRLTWWGNPTRNEKTTAVIEAFTAVDDTISISEEPGEWSGYWDKLATQAAAGDLPDVIQMDEKFLSEYGGRGALLDLAAAGLDTSAFAPGTVEVGEVPDKGLLAINAGLNAACIIVNPHVFEEAGVELPDDSTWTWDSMRDLAAQITEKTPDGTYGMAQIGGVQAVFQLFMRQLGQDQYSADGVGFDAAAAKQLLDWSLTLQDTKAAPDASVSVEDSSKAMDQSLFATGKVGMTMVWSNQVVAHDALIDGGVTVLRPPSLAGSAAEGELWYKASMYWSVSAKTQNKEAALKFVDFLVNSPEAGKVLSVERGVPGNLDVREAITPDLDEANLKAVTYLETIEADLGAAPVVTPQGGGEFEAILTRVQQDVLFGSTDTAAGAQQLIDDLTSALS
ncbi:ABC transporter substrate-binding protein [Brachybacterium hainanense]|uniref:ABC transporter substrate-binding protein n=1 Tax=Brachybacterium hainanense TaxID=1541174 RepID=A0ABV6R6W4_9MICO